MALLAPGFGMHCEPCQAVVTQGQGPGSSHDAQPSASSSLVPGLPSACVCHAGRVHLDVLLGPRRAPHLTAQAVRLVAGAWLQTHCWDLNPGPHNLLVWPGQLTVLLWTSVFPLQMGVIVIPTPWACGGD